MADGANVGSAYVTLFPSMDGFSDELKAMLPGLYEWEDEKGV